MSKLIRVPSAYGFDETISRIELELVKLEVPIFARIDHADNARSAGLEMPATTVLIFGAARGGTPAMRERPDLAYELPLRVLVRQGTAGVELLYRPIGDLAAAYEIPEDLAMPLHLIDKVVAAAVGSGEEAPGAVGSP